jgi:hypothetical protein
MEVFPPDRIRVILRIEQIDLITAQSRPFVGYLASSANSSLLGLLANCVLPTSKIMVGLSAAE